MLEKVDGEKKLRLRVQTIDKVNGRYKCDLCDESDPEKLTKHHLTRKEKRSRGIMKQGAWVWRCSKCSVEFHKRHQIGRRHSSRSGGEK